MKLPHHDQAVVVQAKITRYLLNENHAHGGTKANFFLRFGFTVAQWEVMQAALLQHARIHEVISTRWTQQGINYVIDGELLSPDGRRPYIRTTWCIQYGESIPMFVTAYPMED
jgi:hypothetical protein